MNKEGKKRPWYKISPSHSGHHSRTLIKTEIEEPGEIKEIYKIYNNLKISQKKTSEPRLSPLEIQINIAKSFLWIGGFILGLCIILPFTFPISYESFLFPLFLGILIFLYGVKTFIPQNSYPRKFKDVFIMCCGSFMILMSIPFFYYRNKVYFSCFPDEPCPLPIMEIFIGIWLIIFGVVILKFGINKIKQKYPKEPGSNSWY
jgi:hypothetical protein